MSAADCKDIFRVLTSTSIERHRTDYTDM